MNIYRLDIRSMFQTIKEARYEAAFNLKSGPCKKHPHYFYITFHMFMKGIIKCGVVMGRDRIQSVLHSFQTGIRTSLCHP